MYSFPQPKKEQKEKDRSEEANEHTELATNRRKKRDRRWPQRSNPSTKKNMVGFGGTRKEAKEELEGLKRGSTIRKTEFCWFYLSDLCWSGVWGKKRKRGNKFMSRISGIGEEKGAVTKGTNISNRPLNE